MSELKKPIEYESVTVKVPKSIANWYRRQAHDNTSSLEEEMQYVIIDSARSIMEAMSGEEVAIALGFGDIFYELLGDGNYKPEITDQEVK